MDRGTRGEHEQNPAEGEPATQNPAAGADDDTSYDEGTGDQIRPDAEGAPARPSRAGTIPER
ncbi:hypothetical protein E1161_10300 [Saccharopolyspora aridisoli]|uniref:Uncharacterized protein n=1 Tax=Saccharopolyspora aridisoli TaxID=2530385 RepID=A0A4R4UV20_9PSEU|nr:hypothetical protein [Saccharopolyspora aridisoli]TDC93402.1 hypothetical protein E1161_10300 [Saccharopolyspora aridisoli]